MPLARYSDVACLKLYLGTVVPRSKWCVGKAKFGVGPNTKNCEGRSSKQEPRIPHRKAQTSCLSMWYLSRWQTIQLSRSSHILSSQPTRRQTCSHSYMRERSYSCPAVVCKLLWGGQGSCGTHLLVRMVLYVGAPVHGICPWLLQRGGDCGQRGSQTCWWDFCESSDVWD